MTEVAPGLSIVPARCNAATWGPGMAEFRRFIFKDVGLALAALAVFFLALLVPLHHAQATQNDLAEPGFEAAGAWSICSGGSLHDPEKPSVVPCPICSLVKLQILVPPTIDYVAVVLPIRSEPPLVSDWPAPFDINFQAAPRAPPVLA